MLKVQGKIIKEDILGGGSLVNTIKHKNLCYSFIGFEANSSEIEIELLTQLTNIVYTEIVKRTEKINFFSADSITRSYTPLTIKKGYWGHCKNIVNFDTSSSHNYFTNDKSKVILWTLNEINSKELLASYIEYSLYTNSLFIINNKSIEKNAQTIDKVLANYNNNSLLYKSFFIDCFLNTYDNVDSTIIFTSGGHDYGAVYLNIIKT